MLPAMIIFAACSLIGLVLTVRNFIEQRRLNRNLA